MIRSSLLVLAAGVATLAAAARPNLVVFLADDLGYGDVGCFGSERVKTPQLDRLAAEGARCTAFYGPASVCSPTRVGMLSGRSPFRLGIYTYIPQGSAMHLQRSERALPALLRAAGYDTCFVGKWGANGSLTDRRQAQPSDHGFDYWFAAQNNAIPDQLNPTCFVRNGTPVPDTKGYSAAIIVDEALQWLERRKDKTKPFCLFVWFQEPHRPIATPPEFVQPYVRFGTRPIGDSADAGTARKPPPSVAEYLGNIAHLDHQIGRVLDALEKSGDAARTFALFTSDNGPIEPGSAGPLRGGKSTVWEGGIRMPGIIRWPGHIKPGRVIDAPMGGLDLLPTFCDIANIAVPRDRTLDGESVRALLEGRDFHRAKPQFWWRPNGEVALRDHKWKLVMKTVARAGGGSQTQWYQTAALERSSAQLYDLEADVAEKSDLAARHPDVVARLIPRLVALHREMQQEQQRMVSWDDRALPREQQKKAKGKR